MTQSTYADTASPEAQQMQTTHIQMEKTESK